jgi:hypothetical protein
MASPVRAEMSFLTGFDYSSGDYGAPEDTRILYIPLTFKYQSDSYFMRLTVPYVSIDAPVGGSIIAIGPDGQPIRSATGRRETNSGMGDVVAALGHTMLDTGASGTILDLTGKVKFGTADEAKGLGTGENDYSVQLDGYQTFGNLTWLATAGYRIYGDPPGTDFDNVFFGSFGGVFKVSSETSGGLIFDLRDNIIPGTDPQRDLTAFVTRKTGKSNKIQGYVLTGLSDASADWGLGLMFTFGFDD